MKFSYFASPKASKGVECTYDQYLYAANDPKLLQLCNEIAKEEDKDKRGELKKRLPVITWQAFFPGRRIASEAQPSGLFMLDIDHVDNPFELYSKQIASRTEELGIVYVGKTASTHGLRIVAKCLPTLFSLEECQKWLASNLKVEYDGVCKDFARCSFLVHDSYTYFMDAKAIWQEEADGMCIYKVEDSDRKRTAAEQSPKAAETETPKDQTEGLFGGPADYKGVPYEDICKEWLEYTGGEPKEGERNARLYKLALRLRYITDFNPVTMKRVMPRYGLPESEIDQLIHSALNTPRAADMQKDLREVLDRIDRKIKLQGDEEEIPDVITSTERMPPLPPIFRQWAEIAPDDFKTAVTLCQLPILGALGSRLRSKYLDGKIHSPSFQVSLEAPQASGKSFMVRLVEAELAPMIQADEAQKEKEKEYADKVAEMKMLNIKVNADNKDEILGTKPQGIVRFLPATISITKMLMRLHAAKGLHCFAYAEEIDTVLKAYKRGFSSLSELLRVAFDNGRYGQDYASENSFSGDVFVYYNTLFSGTPKAMRRFYPDVEDGLVSRVLFVTLPDQFGKPMPVWGQMDAKAKQIMDIALERLNEISLIGDEVQPEYELKLDYLNAELDKWIKAQQIEAVSQDDRTRDIFCRRAAVVGFRAGMLAAFLYGGKKTTPTVRKNVCKFAIWVANCMLNQHLLRFNIQGTGSNVNPYEDVYKMLKDEFTRDDVEQALAAAGKDSPVKGVLYKWRLLGTVEAVDEGRMGTHNRKGYTKFKKVKK